jgi:hypothetical protein
MENTLKTEKWLIFDQNLKYLNPFFFLFQTKWNKQENRLTLLSLKVRPISKAWAVISICRKKREIELGEV